MANTAPKQLIFNTHWSDKLSLWLQFQLQQKTAFKLPSLAALKVPDIQIQNQQKNYCLNLSLEYISMSKQTENTPDNNVA